MRNVILNQITLCADGSVGVQLMKQIIDDGEVIFQEPHRTVVDCFGDVEAQMAAVNAHLAKMGFPAVSVEGVERIAALRTVQIASPVVMEKMEEVRVERETKEAEGRVRGLVAENMENEPK